MTERYHRNEISREMKNYPKDIPSWSAQGKNLEVKNKKKIRNLAHSKVKPRIAISVG